MSQENVELVRSSAEAYNSAGISAYLDFFAEDVEVHPDASRFPEARPFRGREEFGRFLADIEQAWEGGGRSEIREAFPVGDRVVLRTDWGGKGRASAVDLRSSLTVISTVRDGKIVKIAFFFDHAEALVAAGLPE
jgi:ketosteroid isomerase-like protein